VKSSSVAIAVLLGLSGMNPLAAEPIRLAQTFAADVIPPYEVSTVISSMGLRPLERPHFRGRYYVLRAIDRRGEEVRVVVDAYAARVVSVTPIDRYSAAEYGRPPVYRRYEAGPPPAPEPPVIETDPRYVPQEPRSGAPVPRYGAPQALPDDDDYPGEGPDEYDADEDDRTGSLPPRTPPRSIGMARPTPGISAPSTRSAAITPPKTPLPRPRPEIQASMAAAPEKPQASASPQPNAAAPEARADGGMPTEPKADSSKPDAKSEASKTASPKTDTPKSGIRVIEIKKPEPRI